MAVIALVTSSFLFIFYFDISLFTNDALFYGLFFYFWKEKFKQLNSEFNDNSLHQIFQMSHTNISCDF